MGDNLFREIGERRLPEICGQVASEFALKQILSTQNPKKTRKEHKKAIKMGYEDGFCPRPECGRFLFAHENNSVCDCNANNTKDQNK